MDKKLHRPLHLAYDTPKQQLIYEFINQTGPTIQRIAWQHFEHCMTGYPKNAADFLKMVQDAKQLPQLWRVVKSNGGDLRGQCPIF